MTPWSPLSGTGVLVTGGSGGIGEAVCRAFASAGADVAVNYLRSSEKAQKIAGEISAEGRTAVAIQANVDREDELGELLSASRRALGRLDVVVHCASLGTFTPLVSTRRGHWDLTMGTHLRAFWEIGRRAPEALEEGGRLIAVSSLGASTFTPAYGAVGVAKGALETLVRYLGAELAEHGIRVNAVRGGPVDGERLHGSPVFSALQEAAAIRPCRRLGSASEIADAVLLLASPLARWVQGQVLVVDGGFSL